jgi:hypothetical protein
MATTKTIELDTRLDFSDPSTLEFFSFLEKHNICPEIVTWTGPAGGNPLVMYTGTDADLRNMLENFYDDGSEDFVEFYMNGCIVE